MVSVAFTFKTGMLLHSMHIIFVMSPSILSKRLINCLTIEAQSYTAALLHNKFMFPFLRLISLYCKAVYVKHLVV